MRNWKLLGILFSLLMGENLIAMSSAFAQTAATFRFEPMLANFSPSGSRATQSFLVTNTSNKPAAIQFRMLKREIDVDGKEINSDADAEFVLYPPQSLVKPGERQTVRVTWVGNAAPNQELAYRIVAEQLPVDLPELRQQNASTSITFKVLFRYIGSVYIVPANAKANITLESAMCRPVAGKGNELVAVFNNQGNAHAILSNLKLNLSPVGKEGTTVRLLPEQLKGITGENILATSKRQFRIPCPSGLPNDTLSGTFEFISE